MVLTYSIFRDTQKLFMVTCKRACSLLNRPIANGVVGTSTFMVSQDGNVIQK